MYASYYRHVAKAEKTGERDIKFTFDSLRATANCRTSLASLRYCPSTSGKAATARAASATSRQTTLEPPLGSGPYRIKEFVAGRSVSLERVKDYWGANLPAQVGQNNFDELRFEFFPRQHRRARSIQGRSGRLDRRELREAMGDGLRLSGGDEKRVVKEEFPINNSGRMQGFVLNLRRGQFKDARLRRAFNYAFDFEEMNKQLFFGQYSASTATSRDTELACSGLPEGAGIADSRDRAGQGAGQRSSPRHIKIRSAAIPEAVRANLRESTKLLKEAGFEISDRKLMDPAGKPVTVEILVQDPAYGTDRAVLQAVAGAHRRNGLDPHRRRCAVSRTGSAVSISTSSSISGRSRFRPATSSGNSGDRRPRMCPAREIPSASKIRRSMR